MLERAELEFQGGVPGFDDDAHGEITVAVRALGERATSVESAALASSVVKALWVLGLDQANHRCAFDEAHRALTAIAGNA